MGFTRVHAGENVKEYARDTDGLILSEDTDFQGGDPQLSVTNHPGILACDTTAAPGEIVAAIRRIEMYTDDCTATVLYVPGDWV